MLVNFPTIKTREFKDIRRFGKLKVDKPFIGLVYVIDTEHEYQWNGNDWIRTFREQVIPDRFAMIPGITIGEQEELFNSNPCGSDK